MNNIVVINPGGRKLTYQELDNNLTAIEPPIWAGLITTYLQLKNIKTRIIDSNGLRINEEETIQLALKENPKLIVIVAYGHNPSASTQTMPSSRLLLNQINQSTYPGKTIIVGGHPASLPKKTLLDENVDFVCTGEGPISILELYSELEKKDNGLVYDFKAVRSLAFNDNGNIIRTAPAPLVKDLDNEMPTLPWDQLPMENYLCHNWHAFGFQDRTHYASIYTTLGCPYQCHFCCIQAPFKDGESLINNEKEINTYRRWSPDSILKQIDHLVQTYQIKHIKIADELFVLNKNHVQDICEGLIERQYDLNIWAYSRIDTITQELAEFLYKAGIKWICLGIETTNLNSLSMVNKSTEKNTYKKSITYLKNNNINIIGNFIFGLPDDDITSMTETLNEAIDLEFDFVNFYSAMAYPGSKLYQQAIELEQPLPDTWNGFSQHSFDCLPLSTKHISGKEVLRFRDQAFHHFFESQKYLQYIEKKFGENTKNHIINMAQKKLKRKYTNK
ncbi:MAG: radical SAM protein [Bacteriovoracaceae bacterium]|jgi:anaerobic magnesium-protoporphyrin IX monomethyl ester cyclase|nr:radical SAM protein [Bacteriovoracaceae bacterium]